VTPRGQEGPTGEASIKERVLAAARAAPSPTRGEGRRVAAALAAVSLAVAGAFFELAGGLAHSRERPLSLTVRMALGWALASAALTWLVRRHTRLYVRSAELVAAAAAGAPFALAAWMARFRGSYPDVAWAQDWPCFVATLALGLTPLLSLVWLRRASEAHHPVALGAALATAASAWAALPVLLWCPVTTTAHVAAGHAAPLAVMALVGCVAGGSSLGVRHPGRPAFAPSLRSHG
jgi:hypothetical protein